MIKEDKDFMATFMMILGGLVLLAAVIFLLAQLVGKIGEVKGGGDAEHLALIEQRLQPVGSVEAGEKQVGPVVRSGKEIYESLCASCHGAGVLGAPRFGNAEDWAPRIAQGMETLLNHAINGLNAMPPRGGDPNLSDEDVEKAVQYMVEAAK